VGGGGAGRVRTPRRGCTLLGGHECLRGGAHLSPRGIKEPQIA
jgi:hypothetical protein